MHFSTEEIAHLRTMHYLSYINFSDHQSFSYHMQSTKRNAQALGTCVYIEQQEVTNMILFERGQLRNFFFDVKPLACSYCLS